MTAINEMTREQLMALVASMQTAPRKLTMKVTAKKPDGTGSEGAISLYGLGRFPVTLYAQGWERLLDEADAIRAFITTNEASLSRKG